MLVDNQLLNKITEEAEKSIRLRMNFNLHESLDAKAQRLINVLLPGTIIPIHRHQHTAETCMLVRGKLMVVFYDDMGGQVDRYLLDPTIGNYGIQIPAGQWHTVEVIEPSTIFEVKDGPYMPLAPEDTLE